MKKALLLAAIFGTLIIAGAHPGPSHAATFRAIGVYGMAWEYTNTHCGNDCTVFGEAWLNGARVWNTSQVACASTQSQPCQFHCAGRDFNWGNALAPEANNCFGQPGDSRWHVSLWTGSVVKSWVRRPCVGGSGFYFSPQASHTLTPTENHNIWMGSQTLASPGSGCQI